MRLRYSLVAFALVALVSSGVGFGAQGDVEIVHDPIECWPVDQFLMVQSSFVPPEDIQTAKFYFRSTAYVDYYYVELTLGRDGGRGIVPKAEPGTPGVSYYVELVTRGFSAFRTEERVVPVDSGTECKRRDPEAAFYNGENPDIAVGATRGGVPQLPPGFQAEGISRFISATGIQGGTGGGGVSGKTIGIIAAIGGGGAAALALSGGGSSETTTTAIGGVTTTTPSSSSTSTAIGGGGSTTTTTGGGGGSSTSSTTTTVGGGGSTTTVVGSTTTIVGSTTTVVGSTTTILGSTTTIVGTTTTIGSSTTTVGTSTTTIGSSTTTVATTSSTTSSPTTTTTPTTSVSSTTTSAGCPSDVFPEVSDTPDPIVANGVNQLTYSIRVHNAGPSTATFVSVNVTQKPPGSEAGQCPSGCTFNPVPPGGVSETKSGRYTIPAGTSGTITGKVRAFAAGCDANPGNDEVTITTRATSSSRAEEGEVAFTYRSQLSLEGRASGDGRIVLNNHNAISVESGGVHVVNIPGRVGENRLEATVNTPVSFGRWQFNFESARGFVGGSIRVEAGQALSIGFREALFSVGPASAPIRFTFELEEPDD